MNATDRGKDKEMLIRKMTETDGVCFSKCEKREYPNECVALQDTYENVCGTYGCPFYKPLGCEDWVRLDSEESVRLYPPEELKMVSKGKVTECQH